MMITLDEPQHALTLPSLVQINQLSEADKMFKQFLQDPSVPKLEKLNSLNEILKAMKVSKTTSSLFGELYRIHGQPFHAWLDYTFLCCPHNDKAVLCLGLPHCLLQGFELCEVAAIVCARQHGECCIALLQSFWQTTTG